MVGPIHTDVNGRLESMTIDDILDLVKSFDGTLAFTPTPDDDSPDIAWGDTFFYYAPDGTMPTATQPFATIVTKNYPGDERSRLDRPGAFRVNVAAGRAEFVERTGHEPANLPDDTDASRADTLIAHPVYGSLGWLSVVNPGPATEAAVRELLRLACDLARSRSERRAGH
jgi:hypothetical protein